MNEKLLQTSTDEISLREAGVWLRCNISWIIFGGIVGLMLSTSYVLSITKKFEARWQIEMAQFVNNSYSSSSNTVNSSGISNNIEEPAALIHRLRTPTAYSEDVQGRCLVNKGGGGDYLSGIFKVAEVRNVPNTVEMAVRLSSRDEARDCAEAIVGMIVAQQREKVEEKLAGRKEQLLEYQRAFLEEQQQLEQMKGAELANFGYLAKVDKLSWLRTRSDAVQEELMLSQLHPAKLVAPIYVPEKPVSRNVVVTILLGGGVGLLLGGLLAFGREKWSKGL